jgi:UPF0755 protein
MTQKFQYITTFVLVIVGIFTATLSLSPPSDFPTGAVFEVKEGESMRSISSRLKEEHIITSALLFRGWVSVLGKDKRLGLGVYNFTQKIPLGEVVAKFIQAPDKPLLSVTIPEGYTSNDIALAFQKVLPSFSSLAFLDLVHTNELDGYLFPSTYYPLPSFTQQDVIALMTSTFDKEYRNHFEKSVFPRSISNTKEVLSLAAILEGEAKTPEDMKIVAGILEKRLSNGMRLQVDVAPSTYRTSGLPKIPINNPGLLAIGAVFDPTATPYLYYLTGKDGKMYYAKTFEEHKKNIQKYLR